MREATCEMRNSEAGCSWDKSVIRLSIVTYDMRLREELEVLPFQGGKRGGNVMEVDKANCFSQALVAGAGGAATHASLLLPNELLERHIQDG